MLLHMKRGLTAALILTLTLTLGVPALAADPLAGGGFAQVAISAKNSDSPTLDLDLALYRRNSSNAFTKVESMDYVTPVNRLTKDMTFNLTPQAQQVTLTVDYLTDLNGDGVYELLSGQDRPVGDVLSADGTLTSASSGVSTQLTQGRTYSITGNALLARGQAAIQDRTTAGSVSYLADMSSTTSQADSILYMLTITYQSPSDNKKYEQCYYVHLYDQLPAPAASDFRDIAPNAWYYDAVDYVVSHGLLTGSTRSTFSPDQQLSRAMLAQTLYNISGQPDSTISHYDDVPQTHWSYNAVSWATSQQLMAGTSPKQFAPDRSLTRQEMAQTLFLYVKKCGVSTSQRADLSGYADEGDVADWARTAMEWAVAEGILAGRTVGGKTVLDPAGSVTRAEFSAVLQTLCEDVLV